MMPISAPKVAWPGRDFPRVAEIQFEMHDPTGILLVTVQNGDGGDRKSVV